ncbi:MAG: hypothetical protein V1839_00615, partial [archaeon]
IIIWTTQKPAGFCEPIYLRGYEMDDERMLILLGFAIIIVVALNLALVFGDMFKLGGGVGMISGFASAECKNTVGGVDCGGVTYAVKPESEGCADDLIPICTNACELARAKANDGRICPTYCTEFCLPQDVAESVLNTKQTY